jgi:hypothetical protein
MLYSVNTEAVTLHMPSSLCSLLAGLCALLSAYVFVGVWLSSLTLLTLLGCDECRYVGPDSLE